MAKNKDLDLSSEDLEVKPKKDKSEKEKKVKKSGMRKYFHDLKGDFKKITWPTRKEIANNTVTVMSMVIIVGAFVAAFDFGLLQLMDLVLNKGLGS
jgi:preprotein translocase subunit SecE